MRINDLHPLLTFGYDFGNIKFPLNPFIGSNLKVSHQFSCKIQVECVLLPFSKPSTPSCIKKEITSQTGSPTTLV